MCVDCKFGKSTGLKQAWNTLRYLVDKVTGLDDLQGRNFSMAMNLPEPYRTRAADETNAEGAKHGPGWKHSWAAALYLHKTLTRYEQEAGLTQ